MAQRSSMADAPEAFQPPSRLEIRKASMHDFVPRSPNSARAKRSPKSSSYAARYEGRINSPGSLMSPKSDAAALVGFSARDETTEEAQWRMRLEPRVVVLVDGVLAALRKGGDSVGKEADETESDNSIAGGVDEATQLARRCFFLLLESQIVDLHYHARLFVLLCGNVHARLKRAAGSLLSDASTQEGFRIQAIHMASALAAYQSYRHHRRRDVDETLADFDFEIAQRQAVLEVAAGQEKNRSTSETKELLELCLRKREVLLGVVQDGVARADTEELLRVQARVTDYVSECATTAEGYNSPQPLQPIVPEPEAAQTDDVQEPSTEEGAEHTNRPADPNEAVTDAEAAKEARRLRLEMELRKLDEARQAVVARLSAINGDNCAKDDGASDEEGSGQAAGDAASSPSGDLSPSHPSQKRICAAIKEAVKETMREMLRWEVLQIDESLCRATMQYLKFSQQYLARRTRASEMLTRRLAMCCARYETLIQSAQKGRSPPTPVDHEKEISPPTPRTTSASPDTRRGDGSSLDPTGQSEIFGLPVSKDNALKECKKQKRMVSETTRQLKKILAEWDEVFIVITDFAQALEYLPADYSPRRAAEEFQQKHLREILVLVNSIRKALATHAHRDRPKMQIEKMSDDKRRSKSDDKRRSNLKFNPGAAEFSPGAKTFIPSGGQSPQHAPIMMNPQMMMAHSHGVPFYGQPGYFPGMANMVIVGSPHMDGAVGDFSSDVQPRYTSHRSSDAESVGSDSSSEWSSTQASTTSSSDHSFTRLSKEARTAHMLSFYHHAITLNEKSRGRHRRSRSNPDMSFSRLEDDRLDDDIDAASESRLGNPASPAVQTAAGPPVGVDVPAQKAGNATSVSAAAAVEEEANAKGVAILSLITDVDENAESGQDSPAVSMSSTSSAGSTGSRSKQHRRAATMDERELRSQVAAAADLPMQKLS